MWKDDLNVHVFKNRTDVAQNLIDDFFSIETIVKVERNMGVLG